MKNNKQLAWSRRIVHSATMKKYRLMNLLLAMLVIGVVIGMFLAGDIVATIAAKIIAGAGVYATIIGFVDVDGDVDNEEKVGKKVKQRLYFIEAAQVDTSLTFPAVVSREMGNIPLLAGEYWHKIDSVLDSPDIKWKGSMGDIAASIVNTGTFILGGIGDDVFDLLEKGIGRGFYVVWEICSESETIRLITGNACKPSKLKEFDGGSDKDKTGTTVTFENECGKLWVKYTGTTPELAADTVSQNATTIAISSNPQYQLTDGTASAKNITAFTGVADSDVGRILTILGSGGSYPSTIDTGDSFIVKSTWTGLLNSQLTVKVYKDTASYKFVEVHRIG
jgi:hypothetical protein